MRRAHAPFIALTALFLLSTPLAAEAQTSQLWGEAGELWSPVSRLPDFSHAGYHDGDAPIPDVPEVVSVKDFGAVGDGVTDDTAAFLGAIAAAADGAVAIPKGRYLLSGQLPISKSHVVLRGEGSGTDGSILYFTKSLTDLLGAAPQWSWYGGLIQVRPPSPGLTTIAAVTQVAARGDTDIHVADASGIAPGDVVTLRLLDDGSGSLGKRLHNDLADSGDCTYQVPLRLDTVVRVAAVAGDVVTLTQPLRVDIDPAWSPEIASFGHLEEVGIEHLAVEFVEARYAGHLFEPGYNAISWNDGVVDSWVRDVRIKDADNGILVDTSVAHLSILGLALEGRNGHHGLNLSLASDLLVQDFTIEADFIHAMTVDHRAHGIVFSRGVSTTQDLALDHHRDSPFENLFTEVGPYNWACGGNTCAGPHAGARNTYWNLGSQMTVPIIWGFMQSNVMGDLSVAEKLTDDNEWYELLAKIEPANLHDAQLTARECPKDPPAACQAWSWDVTTATCIAVPSGGPDCGGTGGGGAGGESASGAGGDGATTGAGASGGATGAGAAAGGGATTEESGCSMGRSRGSAGLVGLAASALVLEIRRRRSRRVLKSASS